MTTWLLHGAAHPRRATSGRAGRGLPSVARRSDTPSARASPGKASLDIFWLKDDSSHILDDLPAPNVLAQEIVEHLVAAPASFREVAAALPRSRETR